MKPTPKNDLTAREQAQLKQDKHPENPNQQGATANLRQNIVNQGRQQDR